MKIQISILNEFGEFKGEILEVTIDQYKNITELSKNFYETGGFEMECEDDGFIIFPPDIIKKSILKIKAL